MSGMIAGIGVRALLGGALKGIWSFICSIPWQIWLGLAIAATIGFLAVSRGHWIDRAHGDEAQLAEICAAVRQASGRPHQDCRLAQLQIRALGASIQTLKGALDDQNKRIRDLGRQSAAQQAAAHEAERQAAKLADQAESVAKRMDRSAKKAPAQPCAVSKELEQQWQ